MPIRHPLGRLTDDEAAKARQMVTLHGAKEAARLLGLADESTMRKAALGEPVHRLTLSVVRTRLPDTL